MMLVGDSALSSIYGVEHLSAVQATRQLTLASDCQPSPASLRSLSSRLLFPRTKAAKPTCKPAVGRKGSSALVAATTPSCRTLRPARSTGSAAAGDHRWSGFAATGENQNHSDCKCQEACSFRHIRPQSMFRWMNFPLYP